MCLAAAAAVAATVYLLENFCGSKKGQGVEETKDQETEQSTDGGWRKAVLPTMEEKLNG